MEVDRGRLGRGTLSALGRLLMIPIWSNKHHAENSCAMCMVGPYGSCTTRIHYRCEVVLRIGEINLVSVPDHIIWCQLFIRMQLTEQCVQESCLRDLLVQGYRCGQATLRKT